jgi:hypothetical protein
MELLRRHVCEWTADEIKDGGRGNYNAAFGLPLRHVGYLTNPGPRRSGSVRRQASLLPDEPSGGHSVRPLLHVSCWQGGLWGRRCAAGERRMIATEKYARANWWCPARRNRIATTGTSGFNLSIFPIKIQWKQALIAWLFPNYFWLNIGRHGKCLGSGCATWRWYEFKRTGWCGLAPRPEC